MSARAVLFITAAIGCALVIALTATGAQIDDSVEDGEGLAGFDRPVPLILMVLAVTGSLAMTSIGKTVVGRIRPPTSDAQRGSGGDARAGRAGPGDHRAPAVPDRAQSSPEGDPSP